MKTHTVGAIKTGIHLFLNMGHTKYYIFAKLAY